MRVYLDGVEIGAQKRAGVIAVNKDVPAFIASSSGTSEHLQGALDDLRIYQRALTAAEVRGLYDQGIASLAERFQELEQTAAEYYQPRETFAATLVSFRQTMMQHPDALADREFASIAGPMVLRGDAPEAAILPTVGAIVIGGVFGIVSEYLANALTKKAPEAAATSAEAA